MMLKITEPRKQILITMHVNNLVILRERTRFGVDYSFIRPSGQVFEEKKARLNKYHIMFLEENNLVSTVWSDQIADRLVLTSKGQRVGRVLSRHYNEGVYKRKAIELEIGELSE